MNKRDYWDMVTDKGKRLYQMGYKSHRFYLLDLLKEKGIISILDVGCGTGPIYELIEYTKGSSPLLKRWNFLYKGVDPSEAMIKTCRNFFPDVDWSVQDAIDLKEKDDSWDCVLMMHSLDYVYDYEKAIQEAKRIAKRYILIVLWQSINYDEGAENRLNNNVDGDEKHDWSLAHLQHFAWVKLKKVFDENKLQVIVKEDGQIVNREGTTNTVILLEKI